MSGFSPQLAFFAAVALVAVGCGDREPNAGNSGEKAKESASDPAVTLLAPSESEVFSGVLHERVFEIEDDSPLFSLDPGMLPLEYLEGKGAVFKGKARAAFDKGSHELTVVNTEEQLLVVEAILVFSEDPYDPLEAAALFLGTIETEKFLTDTIIPEVDFDGVLFKDALAHLEEQAKTLDPYGKGIRISIDPLTTPDVGQTPVTLSLKEERLSKVLWRLGNLAQIRYMVEPSGALFTYGHGPPSPVTNIYRVSDNFESDRLEALRNEFENRGEDIPPDPFASPGPDGKPLPPQDIQDVMEWAGISFPSRTMAVFVEESSLLAVKNTPDQLELVEAWLESVDAFRREEPPAPPDIEQSLDRVRIPTIHVRDLPLVYFLRYLSLLSEGHGAKAGIDSSIDFYFDYPDTAPVDPFGFDTKPAVTFDMESASLRDIIDEVRQATGLEYRIEDGTVVFFSPGGTE